MLWTSTPLKVMHKVLELLFLQEKKEWSTGHQTKSKDKSHKIRIQKKQGQLFTLLQDSFMMFLFFTNHCIHRTHVGTIRNFRERGFRPPGLMFVTTSTCTYYSLLHYMMLCISQTICFDTMRKKVKGLRQACCHLVASRSPIVLADYWVLKLLDYWDPITQH